MAQMAIQAYNDSTVSATKARQIALKGLVMAAEGQADLTKKIGLTGVLLDTQSQSIQDSGIRALSIRVREAGGLEAYLAKMDKLYKETGEQKENEASRLAEINQKIRDFGKKFDNILTIFAGPFITPIYNLSESFIKLATNLADWIQPKMQAFADWIGPWVEQFSSVKSWEEFAEVFSNFWNDIKVKSEKIWNNIKETMGPLVKDVWETVKPIMTEQLVKLFEFIWDAFKTAVLPSWLRTPNEAEKANDAAKLKKEIVDLLKENKQGVLGKADKRTIEKNLEKIEKIEGKASLPPDELRKSRDWAASVLAGQTKSNKVPESLRGEVDKLTAKPDADLKKRIDELKAQIGNLGNRPADQTAGIAAQPDKSGNTSAKQMLSPDQLVNARNWAYSLMTHQDKGQPVPLNLKDEVDKLTAKPDATLKKQVDDFIAQRAKTEQQEKEKAAKEAASKPAVEDTEKTPTPTPAPTPAPAADTARESKTDPIVALNNSMAQLIMSSRQTADNTKRTADLIAGRGNQLRGM
jgi:hypothetical protein